MFIKLGIIQAELLMQDFGLYVGLFVTVILINKLPIKMTDTIIAPTLILKHKK